MTGKLAMVLFLISNNLLSAQDYRPQPPDDSSWADQSGWPWEESLWLSAIAGLVISIKRIIENKRWKGEIGMKIRFVIFVTIIMIPILILPMSVLVLIFRALCR
jgi:hypothetical protein